MPDPGSGASSKEASHKRILRIIIALAVVVRIGSALYQGQNVEALPGVADQISYHELALRVLDGHGFSFGTGWWPATPADQPTAHWSFLYVLYLTGVYYLFGPNPLAARLIQAVITGALQPLLTWRIGRRLFGWRIGLVSAGLCSFYAYFVFYSGALMTESFFIIALLWALDVSTALVGSDGHAHAGGEMRFWVQLGVALGIAALLRQVILLLAPILLLWVAWRVTSLSRSAGTREPRVAPASALARVVVALALFSACILPWTIRNYRAFGQFVLLNTNAGFAFFWGNHPIHGTSFIPILPEEGPKYGELIPEELRGLNEAQMDRALLQRGLRFVIDDPARYLRLSVSRVKEYIRFWPSAGSGRASNYARVLSFGLFFPFMLSGVIFSFVSLFHRRPGEYQQSNPGVALILLAGALYSLVHLLTWTLVRYRLPVDALSIPFAALSLIFAYDHLSRAVSSAAIPLRRTGE